MADRKKTDKDTARQRSLPFMALVLVLGVFGLVVIVVSVRLREDLRSRVLEREAGALLPLVQFQVERELEGFGSSALDLETGMIYALLETSDIEGTLGVQLFDALGNSLFSVPNEAGVEMVEAQALRRLNAFDPVPFFFEDARGHSKFELLLESSDAKNEVPVLELYLPLTHESELGIVGVARYVFDGRETQRVLKSIDEDIAWQGLVAFCSGALLIALIVLVAISRLRQVYNSLDNHANRLANANKELESIARTAAIGAVASHLIHGLRNPLSGLQQYVNASTIELDEEDRQDAQEAGKRMQALISEVVDVIRGNVTEDSFQVSIEEVATALARKHATIAQKKGIQFSVGRTGNVELESRVFNISLLVASNLLQNAIDATSPGGAVDVRMMENGEAVNIEITDTGSGFSSSARENLFSPVESSKSEGSGIGLAISYQLARHIGGSIELVSTGKSGSCMRLSVPISADQINEESLKVI